MNAEKLIGAEASLALVGVVASDLVKQTDRTLPKPRRIMAVFAFYGLLSLIAGFGSGPARLAAAMGGVTALASLILGATGRTIIDLIRRTTGLLTTGGAAAGGPNSSAGSAPPGYHVTQGPNGQSFLVPGDPRRSSVPIVPGTESSARVRAPSAASAPV